jgi:hypothetical protein
MDNRFFSSPQQLECNNSETSCGFNEQCKFISEAQYNSQSYHTHTSPGINPTFGAIGPMVATQKVTTYLLPPSKLGALGTFPPLLTLNMLSKATDRWGKKGQNNVADKCNYLGVMLESIGG